MKFDKTMIVGLKSLAGSIASMLIMWLIMLVTAFLLGTGIQELMQSRPSLFGILIIAFFGVSIFVSGWVLHKLWGWN